MNNLIIFDLDGVLIDSKDIHFAALNMALFEINPNFTISRKDQEEIYEGLTTKTKLDILSERVGLNPALHDLVWKTKQKYSGQLLENTKTDKDLQLIMKKIKADHVKIAVASNSIRSTVELCLNKLGIIDLVDYIVSNEDVQNPKPHPEMYWKAMSHFKTIPSKTVIFEDSIIGRLGARDSGAKLIEIENRDSITFDTISLVLDEFKTATEKWVDPELNVLIPMAGLGSRFADAGYTFPKPLIEVGNKAMIQAVVDSLSIKAKYTYIVQEDHYLKYNLEDFLNSITPDCNIVRVDGLTEGAAATALLSKQYIDNNKSLVIANSDQIVEWSSRNFLFDLIKHNADGGIATFTSNHPKWSYAEVNDLGHVTRVEEKRVISNIATVGIYYWKKGSDFVKYAEQMISKNIRTNNEFYICPVFNEAILDGKKILTGKVDKMWGVGTPEDLENYMSHGYLND